jgi:nucleoside 2-deoxyribosyltransferase
MPSVFLSHSARDARLAADIARELRKHEVEPFDISERAVTGEYVRRDIKQAIRRADGFILVLGSPQSASSSWVSYELGTAEALNKPVLILLSHNHATAELPSDLTGLPVLAFDPGKPALVGREIVDRLFAAA